MRALTQRRARPVRRGRARPSPIAPGRRAPVSRSRTPTAGRSARSAISPTSSIRRAPPPATSACGSPRTAARCCCAPGSPGACATTRLTQRRTAPPRCTATGAHFAARSLSDGRRQIILIGDRRLPPAIGERLRAADRAAAAARSTCGSARRRDRSPSIERLLILLPVLMWVVAALVSWWLVHRLLIRPLRRLQRAVTAYQPGDDPPILPAQDLAPATEIQRPARRLRPRGRRGSRRPSAAWPTRSKASASWSAKSITG